MPVSWPKKLTKRAGAKDKMAGIEVYHDFDWGKEIGHNKSAFRGGKRLAMLVQSRCPKEKTPALLLTTLETAQEGKIVTEKHHIAVVRIDLYKKLAVADPATTYFATKLREDIIDAPKAHLIELTESQKENFDTLIDDNLDLATLQRWINRNQVNRSYLLTLIENDQDLLSAISDSSFLSSIIEKAGKSNDLGRFASLISALPDDLSTEQITQIAEAITKTTEGRRDTAVVLNSKLKERVADAKSASDAFKAILENQSANETDMQEFIQDHPWLIGLEYIKVRSRQAVVRGTLDFLLERYDGYHDMIELKSPDDPIIIEKSSGGTDYPSSPSQYSLSPSLSNAIAQSHNYRQIMTKYETTIEEQFGIHDPAHPFIFIIIGKSTALSETSKKILRQLNLSMHRVQILPYDILSSRAEKLLTNLEQFLSKNSQGT